MTCLRVFAWSFIYCALTGPGVPSEWDLSGDGQFDLRDVAILQNSALLLDGQVWFEVEVMAP